MVSIITSARKNGRGWLGFKVLAIAATFGLSLLFGGSASATTADPNMYIYNDPVYTSPSTITFESGPNLSGDMSGLCWKTTSSTLPVPDLNDLAAAGGNQMYFYCSGLGLNVGSYSLTGATRIMRANNLATYTQYSLYPIMWKNASDTVGMNSYNFYTSEYINPGDNPTFENLCGSNCDGNRPEEIGQLHSKADDIAAGMTTDPYGTGVDNTSPFYKQKTFRYCYSTNSADLSSVPANDTFCLPYQLIPSNTPITQDATDLTQCTKYYYRLESGLPNPIYSHIYSFWTTGECSAPPQTCDNGAINYPACDDNQGGGDITPSVPSAPGTSDPSAPNTGVATYSNGSNTGAIISTLVTIASAVLIGVVLIGRKLHRETNTP